LGPLDLIEEATHLLRRAPLRVVVWYYLGTIPFLLALLHFWADMSRSAFAYEHCARAALGMAVAFAWMKTGQVVFASMLSRRVAGLPEEMAWRAVPGMAARQWLLHSTGLFVVPLALVAAFPAGWAYGFYQSATALGESGSLGETFRLAWRQTRLWPVQNHVVLALLILFGGFVFLNLMILVVQVPMLLNMLLGVETIFSKSPYAMFNTTLLASLCGLTYLCLDPLVKTVFVLRCFHGESLDSGEDLKAELRRVGLPVTKGLAMAVIVWMAVVPACLGAEDTRSSEPASTAEAGEAQGIDAGQGIAGEGPAVAPEDLDRRIGEVISRSEFSWRLPREKLSREADSRNAVLRFLEDLGRSFDQFMQGVGQGIRKLFEGLGDLFSGNRNTPSVGVSTGGLVVALKLFAVVVAVGALVWLGFVLHRSWRQRHGSGSALAGEGISAVPDLRDEEVAADQLPEDEWLRLAAEMRERGELRLALRALYLANLAHLGGRELVHIERSKSNREYQVELKRRARHLPELQAAFGDNVGLFDRVWYGLHDASDEVFSRFRVNYERIQTA
jgi:hypothetical protein